ncbi:hypothetical protein P7C71_g2011, partial [Lecanoromycetidae sp. Uapishka_2]
MIQKPYTVAEISRDITGASGNILSADVHTVVGSKKRKRTELALAIDHEGVNIYDYLLKQSSPVHRAPFDAGGRGPKPRDDLRIVPPFHRSLVYYATLSVQPLDMDRKIKSQQRR